MNLKVIIYITEDGEVFFYVPDENGEALFVNPRIKKKDRETKEDKERTH